MVQELGPGEGPHMMEAYEHPRVRAARMEVRQPGSRFCSICCVMEAYEHLGSPPGSPDRAPGGVRRQPSSGCKLCLMAQLIVAC